MTFEQFIINKYPLYAEIDFNKINVNWGEVFKLHDEWLLQLADNGIGLGEGGLCGNKSLPAFAKPVLYAVCFNFLCGGN